MAARLENLSKANPEEAGTEANVGDDANVGSSD
jgi:hypothetical protein